MGTVVGTCMPEIEHHQTTADIATFAPIRRRRYGKFKYGLCINIDKTIYHDYIFVAKVSIVGSNVFLWSSSIILHTYS